MGSAAEDLRTVRPGAIAAGIATFMLIRMFTKQREDKCTEMTGLWSEVGPIHIVHGVQDEAFKVAFERMRSLEAGGETYTVTNLQYWLATHFRPECDWNRPKTPKAQQVLDGFRMISEYTITRMGEGEAVYVGA